MSEQQAERAMRILTELYADKMGIENPVITINKKDDNL